MTGIFAAMALAAAMAQPSEVAPAVEAVSPDHAPARLNEMLAEKNYVELGRTIQSVSRQADLRSDLDWLKDRMLEGNSAFVSMLYSRLLWQAVAGLPEETRNELRQTAAMAHLYAFAAIRVDGPRCGDATAPLHRAEQLMAWNPEIWPFLRELSPEHRQRLVSLVLAIEARTAARREALGDVDFLCRAGMEETRYNLEHGTSREVPSAPGVVGRTIELSGDGRYVPSQRPEAEWRAQASAAREALPGELLALVEGQAGRNQTGQ